MQRVNDPEGLGVFDHNGVECLTSFWQPSRSDLYKLSLGDQVMVVMDKDGRMRVEVYSEHEDEDEEDGSF